MKKALIIVGVALLVTLMGGSPGWSQDKVVIGGVAPLSAPGAAESGTEMKIAMQMAVNEIGEILGKTSQLSSGGYAGAS